MRKWWSGLRGSRRHETEHQCSIPDNTPEYVPSPEDYPTFPPPSPSDILKAPDDYWTKIGRRKFGAPQGVFEDSSLYALYRLYEFVVLDKVYDYRNTLEVFWRQHKWVIKNIQDPQDEDPERYAFLAGCTYLLARSFNHRVKLGLKRGMSSLITPEEADELRNTPDHLRQYESVPEWASKVPALETTLEMPTHDGKILESKDDKRADPDFLAKNILLWTPHIFFT